MLSSNIAKYSDTNHYCISYGFIALRKIDKEYIFHLSNFFQDFNGYPLTITLVTKDYCHNIKMTLMGFETFRNNAQTRVFLKQIETEICEKYIDECRKVFVMINGV